MKPFAFYSTLMPFFAKFAFQLWRWHDPIPSIAPAANHLFAPRLDWAPIVNVRPKSKHLIANKAPIHSLGLVNVRQFLLLAHPFGWPFKLRRRRSRVKSRNEVKVLSFLS